jgi:hypothetical protein
VLSVRQGVLVPKRARERSRLVAGTVRPSACAAQCGRAHVPCAAELMWHGHVRPSSCTMVRPSSCGMCDRAHVPCATSPAEGGVRGVSPR